MQQEILKKILQNLLIFSFVYICCCFQVCIHSHVCIFFIYESDSISTEEGHWSEPSMHGEGTDRGQAGTGHLHQHADGLAVPLPGGEVQQRLPVPVPHPCEGGRV